MNKMLSYSSCLFKFFFLIPVNEKERVPSTHANIRISARVNERLSRANFQPSIEYSESDNSNTLKQISVQQTMTTRWLIHYCRCPHFEQMNMGGLLINDHCANM